MYDIIGKKKIYLSISAILMIASIGAVTAYGFKQGVDFAGGTAWHMRFANNPTVEEVQEALAEDADLKETTVIAGTEGTSVIMRLPELSEQQHAEYRTALEKRFGAGDELGYETIGPAVGKELRSRAFWAFLGVILAISLYIAFAFREVSWPVSSWKYGIVTLVTLFHDALIPIGLIAWLGHAYGVEMNTNIIVAILVVMGFSVHDTIVVFDRIRENLRNAGNRGSFKDIVNASVNQTIVRSINTSLTLVLTLVALLMFGATSTFPFILVMLVGTVAGIYSSIFVASPLLVIWNRKNS